MDNHAWMQEWSDHACGVPCVFGDILEQVPLGSIRESLPFQKRIEQAGHVQSVLGTLRCSIENSRSDHVD